ncbi:RloB family protein [Streptomyces xiamenensis]
MGRGKPLNRPRETRPEYRRFLIYCEGARTEEQYFVGLRRTELSKLPVTVKVGSAHGEAIKLVREAVKHKERAPTSRADRFTAYDEVWCVMDVEAPAPQPGLTQALETARRNNIEVALTNPCFELWLLLHFQDVTGYRTSTAAQKLLERHTECGYTPERKHLEYSSLKDRFAKAESRAQGLRGHHGSTHRNNPWTDVDLLISKLLMERPDTRAQGRADSRSGRRRSAS